jgi:HPt (histidine-containing phosphotransfer) domain-containing protein
MNDETGSEVFSSATLSESCGGDEAVMRELMDLFVDQATEIWSRLSSAMTSGDCETVRRAAHKLAGSCASCGLPALTVALRDLENSAGASPAPPPPGVWAACRREAVRAADALERRFGVRWTIPPGLQS